MGNRYDTDDEVLRHQLHAFCEEAGAALAADAVFMVVVNEQGSACCLNHRKEPITRQDAKKAFAHTLAELCKSVEGLCPPGEKNSQGSLGAQLT